MKSTKPKMQVQQLYYKQASPKNPSGICTKNLKKNHLSKQVYGASAFD